MGLTATVGRRLDRWARRRPHLLVVSAPGSTRVRLVVEAAIADLDGVMSLSPADADVLVVVGHPGPDLAGATERLWQQVPGPRARAEVADPAGANAALEAAVASLASAGEDEQAPGERPAGADHGRGDPGGTAPTSPAHDGVDHGEMEGARDPAGGEDEEAGAPEMEMEMEMPGGLAMADRAPDRDGLKLDVLHVPLGPWLPDWPVGLVLDTVVQGDVVQSAEARFLGAAVEVGWPFWHGGPGDGPAEGRRIAAAHLDSLGRLLGVAGWPVAARRARSARDLALGDGPLEAAAAACASLSRQVRRSRALRWSTGGLGVLGPNGARAAGVTGPAARAAEAGGDVTARWLQWLDEAGALLAGGDPPAGEGPRGQRRDGAWPSSPLLAVAARLVVGLDVASARLVVASLDPDPDELAFDARLAISGGDTG